MPNMTDNIVVSFIKSTPPITRILVALTIIVSSSAFLNFVKPQQLSYSRFCFEKLQFYRIFTTFFYHGKSNFELLVNFIFLYRYSSMLEDNYGRKSDYFFVLFLVFLLLFITSNIIYIPFLAVALSNTLTYIWSRKNPQGFVQIFSFISFNAFYLPFVFPVISFIFDGKISKDEVVGIIVGQVVYYFKDVYPRFGRDFLKTPCWCHKLFNERDSCCNQAKPRDRQKHRASSIQSSVVESIAVPDEKVSVKFEEDRENGLKPTANGDSGEADVTNNSFEKEPKGINFIEKLRDNGSSLDVLKLGNKDDEEDIHGAENFESSNSEMVHGDENFESSDSEMVHGDENFESSDSEMIHGDENRDDIETIEKSDSYSDEDMSGFESLEIDGSDKHLDANSDNYLLMSESEQLSIENKTDNKILEDKDNKEELDVELCDEEGLFESSDGSNSFKSEDIDQVISGSKNSVKNEPQAVSLGSDEDSWNSE